MYGTGRVRFSAQQAEFETINYAAELAGTIHFTDNIRNEVLLGASRVIRTLASSPNIRTFFDQNFANPVFIADPGLEYSTLPPASKIDDKGRSEEHTSELQSLMRISYAVFCLKKKNKTSHHILLGFPYNQNDSINTFTNI